MCVWISTEIIPLAHQLITKIILTIFCIFCILTVSCGVHDSTWLTDPDHSSSLIVHPTAEEIASQSVLPLQYLVAFKQKRNPATHHLDFEDTFFEKSQNYFHNYVETGIAEDISFISSVHLTKHPAPGPDELHHLTRPLIGQSDIHQLWSGAYDSAEISLVKFSSTERAKTILSELADQGKIWFAEPNRISYNKRTRLDQSREVMRSYANLGEKGKNYFIKNTQTDLVLDKLAQLSNQALAKILDNPPIIAILDSGVDVMHSALKGRVADLTRLGSKACGNYRYGCNTELGLDGGKFPKGRLGNGKSYPIGATGHGLGCIDIKGQDRNSCSHGTHVAGLAVGYAPEKSIYGVCPFCLFLPVRITHDKTQAISDAAILRGMQFVSLFYKGEDPIIRVINNSYGVSTSSRSVGLVVRTHHTLGKGIVLVGAAGNEDSSYRNYPAAYHGVISVSNITSDNTKHESSNSGKWVDVAAPGTSVWSSIAGNKDASMTGTSMAAPIVSGIAGLLLALRPSATAAQISYAIIESADNSIYNIEQNKVYKRKTQLGETYFLLGRGIVNAKEASVLTLGASTTSSARMRVEGCGSLGGGIHHPAPLASALLYLILFSLPTITLLIKSFRPQPLT